MRNAIRAYDLFSSLDPFKESDLLRAHGILMESFVDDAGKYRASGVGVFGETGMVHLAPPAGARGGAYGGFVRVARGFEGSSAYPVVRVPL